MAWYRCGGGGLPAGLQSDMDTVLNKKLGTSTTYPPTDWPDTVNLMGPLPEKTASGAIAHIEDGADGVPLKNWLVTLPASLDGYTAIGGSKGGANFIELYTRANHNGIDYSINADGSLHREGTASGNSFNNGNATNYSNCPFKLRAGTYTLSVSGSGDNASFTSFGIYLASGASFTAQGITGNGTKTFTVSEDFGAWYYIKTNSGVTVNDDVYIWISAGSTADAYEAYTAPTQYTASLGRTIYGGTADIVTGEGEDENGNAFTFTPITAETALGVNNFWADEGDSDVTYRADISLALQALGGGGRGLMMMRPTEPEETEETEETEGLEDELNR